MQIPTNFDALRRQNRAAVRASIVVAAAVTPIDLDRPTPCTEWDVQALLAHMTEQHREFATACGATVDTTDYREAADAVLSAFAEADADAMVRVPSLGGEQELPVTMAVAAHLVDFVAHSWDLAVAIGVDPELPDDAVAAAEAIAEQIPDSSYGDDPGSAFGPRVSTDAAATRLERTLGLLGRDPAWRAPLSR